MSPQATPTLEDIQWRKRGKRSAPFVFTSQRLKEVVRLLTHRYGGPIVPGIIDDIEIMLSIVARYDNGVDRDWLMHDCIDRRAPWLDPDHRERLIAEPMANPVKWTATFIGQ